MTMGRPKGFSRDDVLTKTIAVFWQKGFAETSLQDLEQATGVNKSGLYTEFKNKEDIFLESLRFYLQTRGGDEILAAEPQGWNNIQRFLRIGQVCYLDTGQRGCFSVNSLRDISGLPPEAHRIIDEHNANLKRLLIGDIRAESAGASNAPLLADMILTFFSGLCIEQNVQTNQATVTRKINGFMDFLRASQ